MHLRTFSSRIFLVVASLMFLGSARSASADTITLMWDASSESAVTGYIVHVGTQPGTYTQHVDVGLSTAYAFSSAVPGQQYCFAVSAYVAGPLEGGLSNEVCGYSNTPPTLVNPGARTSPIAQATTLQLQGADPDGQPVAYSATGLPAGVTLQSSTGFISGTPTTAGAFTVNATVSDGVLTASQSFTWTITAADTVAPTVTITGPTSAATYTSSSSSLALAGTASDNVGVTHVSWVNDRGGSGTAIGTAAWSVSGIALLSGANVLTVTASDAAGNTSNDVLTVNVTANGAPTLTNPGSQVSTLGQPFSLQLVGSDPEGSPLTYSAHALPPGLSITTSGLIFGTPTFTGSDWATVTVSDGALTASHTIWWTVVAAPADAVAPVVAIAGPTSAASWTTATPTVTLSGTATDNIGVVQVTWANDRGGNGAATGTGSWSVSAIALQTGANLLTVTARDAAGNTGIDVLTVTLNVNSPPTLMNPGALSSSVAQATSMQFVGSDPNGDSLTYSATGLPAGLLLTASNGLIAGTPLMTGSYQVTATVSDGTLTATQTFMWTITPNASASTGAIRLAWDANTEPGIVGYIVHAGIQSGVYAQHYDVGLTTTWLFSNAVSGQRYCFAVSAYFAGPIESLNSAEVCGYANVAPTLDSVDNQYGNVGEAVTLQLSATDPEGSTLAYGATGLPPGIAVTPATGLITGMPTTAGTFSVMATVSDGSLTASRSFTWTIAPDTTAPVVSISVPTSAATYVATSATLTLGGTASDVVGVTNVSWVNSRGGGGSANGTSSWSVSGIALASGQNAITVTARDAAGNTASDVITVTWNTTPTLAVVSDRTTEVGQPVSIQLSGSDADGDVLTYGAVGLPPGMALTVSTGLISGTPTSPGTYTVTVTVFDAAQSASRSFTWTVTADATAPSVAITGPTSAAAYSTANATIALSGTAGDNVGVVQVMWTNDRGGSGTATGTTSWSAANIALQSGANVITVTARDAVGHTSTDVLTVTYATGDTVAPTLRITVPTTASSYTTSASSLSLKGPAADNVAVTQVTWSSDRGGSGIATGTTSWRATVSVQTGVNVLTVTARDAAGNIATDVITIVRPK